jgi:hypothetical protein
MVGELAPVPGQPHVGHGSQAQAILRAQAVEVLGRPRMVLCESTEIPRQ